MNMLTSRVLDAWCLDVADRHRGQVVMMKMFVELRQITHVHGRPQGGARRGTCPPLEIQKYGGPPKDNLTGNFFFKHRKN